METNNKTAPITKEKERDFDRNQMERLASLDFIPQRQNLFINGLSGTGKSYITKVLNLQVRKRKYEG